MFIIPFLSIILQLTLSFFFINFSYTYSLMFMHRTTMFWEILITLFIPLVIISGISISFLISNPIWALLYILVSFVLLSILLLNIGIEFITFFFIIVYLGALMMLFLFVIMLLNLHALSKNSNNNFGILKIIFVFFLSHIITILIIENMELINISPLYSLTNSSFFDYNVLYFLNLHLWNNAFVFKTLYTDNIIFFIIITLVLLYALIGALTVISMIDENYKYLSEEVNKKSFFFKKSILFFISDPFMQNYYSIIIFFIISSIILCLLLCSIPYILNARNRKDENTISEYECGFEPFDSATRQPFTVEFYIIGILFLIFDVEIMLVSPWSLLFSFFAIQEIIIMLFFLILLALGFLYEASLGVLSWGHEKMLFLTYQKK